MSDKDKTLSNNDLIFLLEKEMQQDIAEIDVLPEDESDITMEAVQKWYLMSETIIRVIANILKEPLNPAINQLRYAGHHILKASLTDLEGKRRSNLIEAFKHCKRSTYDALDFYVYKLNDIYRVLIPYLPKEKTKDAERALEKHLREIMVARFSKAKRIEYYQEIMNGLISGLEQIEKINAIQRECGLSDKIIKEKKGLLDDIESLKGDNQTLKEHNEALRNQNEQYEQTKHSKRNILLTMTGIILTVILSWIAPGAFVWWAAKMEPSQYILSIKPQEHNISINTENPPISPTKNAIQPNKKDAQQKNDK
ncbi:MAG: hypothetical protein LBU39_06985 [Desulfobulbaceae bacterium]|jgi:hypothetical protein|nr:hypothetical protein [Desulfobulbaceae bacterium]